MIACCAYILLQSRCNIILTRFESICFEPISYCKRQLTKIAFAGDNTAKSVRIALQYNLRLDRKLSFHSFIMDYLFLCCRVRNDVLLLGTGTVNVFTLPVQARLNRDNNIRYNIQHLLGTRTHGRGISSRSLKSGNRLNELLACHQ
jgi:hypothetical protein